MHNTAVMLKCKITVNVETQYTGKIETGKIASRGKIATAIS